MSDPDERWFRRSEVRAGILLSLLFGCTLLALHASLVLRISIAYTHLFYIPIILSGLWYGTRGIGVAVYLGALHLVVDTLSRSAVDPIVLIRIISFIAAGLVVGWVAERMQRENRALLEYLASYTRRLASPRERGLGRFDGIRMSLGWNVDIERMRKAGDVGGLILSLQHRSTEIRYQAADALGLLQVPEAMGALDRALHDPDTGVRWKAAEALGRIGAAAIPVLGRAARDCDEDVRWRAVLALGVIDGEETIRSLIPVLEDEDRYVRDRAILALSGKGHAAVESLTGALFSRIPRKQVAAAQALERIGDPDTLDALKKALDDEHPEVRSAADAAILSIIQRHPREP